MWRVELTGELGQAVGQGKETMQLLWGKKTGSGATGAACSNSRPQPPPLPPPPL